MPFFVYTLDKMWRSYLARLKKKDRIIKYLYERGYQEVLIFYVTALMEVCDNGCIKNYAIKYHSDIVKNLFNDNRNSYNEIYLKLLQDEIIKMEGLDLRILLWDDDVFYRIRYNLPRRKYSRSIHQDQQSISDMLDKLTSAINPERIKAADPLKKVVINNLDEVKVKYDWAKIQGIKIPRSLLHLFIGNQDGDTYLTKEEMRHTCGLLSQLDSNGYIVDFRESYSFQLMLDLFDDNSVSISTCYDVHRKLRSKGVITLENHPQKGVPCLRINGYKEGFGKDKNYVIVPYAVFQKYFKECETSSIKLFFDWIFKLNNGDDKGGYKGKDKVIRLKAFTTKLDTRADKQKYYEFLRRHKKRCKSEVRKLLVGDGEHDALQNFFDFDLNPQNASRGVIDIRIKEQYFVSKKNAERTRLYLDPLERYKKKAAIIEEVLMSCTMKCSIKDKRDFVRILKSASRREIELLLTTLEIDNRNRQQRHWKEIRSLGAYLKWLYEQYRQGDRTIIYGKLHGDPETFENDEYEEMIENFEEEYGEDDGFIA